MEYLAAVLLIAELIYCIVCAARLRKDGKTGGLAAWAVGLCAASDLALLLPLLLAGWLPALPAFWSPAGELADVLLDFCGVAAAVGLGCLLRRGREKRAHDR